MNDPKETQQELFEEFSATPKKPERFPAVSRAQKPILFSTNTEQLLMAGIMFILVLCGVFFLGVIRGKVLAGRPLAEPAREEVVVNRRPAPSVVAPTGQRTVQTSATTPPARTPASVRPLQGPMPELTSVKPYTVQLVTHRKKEFAEAEMNALRSQGFYSFLIPSGEYFQVCAGQYASKDEAKKDLARFSAKYKDCFLRRR